MTKEEDGVCPSVRLRQVYIPLWQVPLSEKKQVCNESGIISNDFVIVLSHSTFMTLK